MNAHERALERAIERGLSAREYIDAINDNCFGHNDGQDGSIGEKGEKLITDLVAERDRLRAENDRLLAVVAVLAKKVGSISLEDFGAISDEALAKEAGRR